MSRAQRDRARRAVREAPRRAGGWPSRVRCRSTPTRSPGTKSSQVADPARLRGIAWQRFVGATSSSPSTSQRHFCRRRTWKLSPGWLPLPAVYLVGGLLPNCHDDIGVVTGQQVEVVHATLCGHARARRGSANRRRGALGLGAAWCPRTDRLRRRKCGQNSRQSPPRRCSRRACSRRSGRTDEPRCARGGRGHAAVPPRRCRPAQRRRVTD